ncbi:hypothetical protein ABZP36_020524 [Zizania latifolia]
MQARSWPLGWRHVCAWRLRLLPCSLPPADVFRELGPPHTVTGHAVFELFPCEERNRGPCRTAPVDPAYPSAPACRTAAAEEDVAESVTQPGIKQLRLPEIQQLVRSLTVENDGLREEMEALQRACMALSKENCKLEKRVEQSSKANGMKSEEQQAKAQPGQRAAEQGSQNGFVLPDLNLPSQDMADGSAP